LEDVEMLMLKKCVIQIEASLMNTHAL